jgi:hypothetical protein
VNRIEASQTTYYDGQARGKAQSPWNENNITWELEQWNDDVFFCGINDQGTLEELAFGIFQWA